ncbi:MAG: hypothetical protein J6Z46_07065 [Lachnospiraceae bacterium]|nr:hypothetical protein [Lachnospiraceae bacterium]
MEYIFTERAHLMCPNMCFGIVMLINKEFNEGAIGNTVKKLAEAHPFLRAHIGFEEQENRFFYDVMAESQAEIAVHTAEVSGIGAPEVMREFERITARDFDLFKEGMLKVSAWPSGSKTAILMVFHHLLADGRGALELAKEFADCYAMGKEPVYAEEKLISSASEFPAGSELPFVSRMLVNRANRQWRKENRRLTFQEYHRFADEFLKNDPVTHDLSVVGESELSGIAERCKKEGVTVNDHLLAKLFTEEKTNRIVIAADLRKTLKCYNTGALGNYSTAFSVELKKHGDDVFTVAKQVHEEVQKTVARPSSLYLVLQCYAALEPGLLDAAMMAARGNFSSKAAGFIGKMFFHFDKAGGYSVTNLGKTESASIEEAFFIPPASPAMKKTLGVLTMNGRMTVCSSERKA